MDWTLFAGRSHVLVVHLPIGLLLAAWALDVPVLLLRGRSDAAERSPLEHAIRVMVLLGALGAVVSVATGWLEAGLPAGDTRLRALHRWLAIGATGLAVLAALTRLGPRRGRLARISHLALLTSGGALIAAAHFGGSLVHGSNHLTAALWPAPATDPPTITETSHFARHIQPILDAHCTECHGGARPKAGLSFDRRAGWFDGEPAPIVPGNAERSELIVRITRPPGDDARMPPRGDPVPAADVARLRAWIEAGASLEAPAVEQPPTAEEPPAPASPGDVPPPDTDRAAPALAPVDRAVFAPVLERLAAAGAHAAWVAVDTPAVRVSFVGLRARANDDTLALLAGLEPVLVQLDLSGTSVSDAGVAALTPFARLERLDLGRTAITDATLGALAGLEDLTTLNLHSTAVTDAGIAAFAGHPRLARLYLWDTRVTATGAASLRAATPRVKTVRGDIP